MEQTQINTTGRKDDGDKLRWDLLPIDCVEDVVKILTFGANKYAPNNWQQVESDRYYAALMRHLSAWRQGEKIDGESGLPHLAHTMCNVLFLLWKQKHQDNESTSCNKNTCQNIRSNKT